ncbi:MAG: type II toxin-antitoxin system VapC family toxin [Planctomycetaceae bacterium]
MIMLDTDYLTVLKYARDSRFRKLAQRMADSVDQDFATTAITLEEQLRGWLAEINRFSDPEKQISAYSELTGLIEFFGYWSILPFDTSAASRFRQFRSQKCRAGSMDLKIASIAVSLDCVLLTANTRDFASISGLRIDNWLE